MRIGYLYHLRDDAYSIATAEIWVLQNLLIAEKWDFRWKLRTGTTVTGIILLFPVDRNTHEFVSNQSRGTSKCTRWRLFFCSASWLSRTTWCSFTTCLSSRRKLKKSLWICPDHMLSWADKQQPCWQFYGRQKPTPERAVRVRALARDMFCVLGRDTLLSRCLSPPRCVNGYQRI